MGIAPDWPVAAVQMWYPRHPHTHFEVGAVINGRFAKFDFTTSGYRLIYNSTPQAVGARFERCHEFALDSVTAASFYHTFLYVAQKNGPYDAGSNDCHTFAVDLCQQFGGTWT